MSLQLSTPIQYVKGVGPKLSQVLNDKGIHTVEDLVLTLPRAYEDRRAVKAISEFEENAITVTTVQVVRVFQKSLKGRRRILHWQCSDTTGEMSVMFFHIIPSVHLGIKAGMKLRLVGKPVRRGRGWQMVHPQFRVLQEEDSHEDEDAVVRPIYPEVAPLTQKKWHSLVQTCLNEVQFVEDLFSPAELNQLNLPFLDDAIRFLHSPPKDVNIQQLQENLHPMYLRLVFEELFLHQCGLMLKHDAQTKSPGLSMLKSSDLSQRFISQLPFELTNDQHTVIERLREKMIQGERLYSLIQGDVGSGKTVVGTVLGLHVIESGYQVALMVPTELLAEQHFKTIKSWLEPIGVEVDLLTGSLSQRQREVVLENVKTGRSQFVIGTHALIQKGVIFKDLGLVVVDEQHRFGVEQRLKLSQLGRLPHQIHMTATPIPRTLALTLFGDMDVYAIREKPKGRRPIKTKVVGQSRRDQVYPFLAQECEKGFQAYVVYPLIEESETLDLKNATEEFEKLKVKFPKLRIELLHGRMSQEDRDAVMRLFREGKVQILVSTTVVEVGVDVPKATVMVVENAERFGLSQLHQLRGRVGRGDDQSWCILITGYGVSSVGEERLAVMEETGDGFVIAERDLEIRGPGEFIGSKQSGIPAFRYASLVKHQDVLSQARDWARKMMTSSETETLQRVQKQVKRFYGDRLQLLEA